MANAPVIGSIGSFLRPKAPPISSASTSINPDGNSGEDQATRDRMQRAADRERNKKGSASTLLTGGQGLTDQAPVSRQTLLGT